MVVDEIDPTRVRPLHDLLFVREFEEEEKTPGGLVIPDTAKGKEPVRRGKVVAVGPGVLLDSGEREPVAFRSGVTVVLLDVGHVVLYRPIGGASRELKIDGATYRFVQAENVLGVEEKE